LARLERATSPFGTAPRPNEHVHWVRPSMVVEVKFDEWTNDGVLRQPVYLGLRDDKSAPDVTREPTSVQRRTR
ncbi:MAG: non-homologous end-joining DNA ligase, partial [Gemmatimonadaceae bacterium]